MRLGLRRLLDHLTRAALFVDDFLEELAHDVVLVLAELDLELRPEQAAPTRFDGELAPARKEGHQFAPVQTVSVSDGQNGVLFRRVLQESSDFVVQLDHAVYGATWDLRGHLCDCWKLHWGKQCAIGKEILYDDKRSLNDYNCDPLSDSCSLPREYRLQFHLRP